MKKVMFSAIIFTTILTTGCDTNDKDNLTITIEHYVDTTETVKINTFNGFKLIKSKRINNKDGSIRIILDFDKPLK